MPENLAAAPAPVLARERVRHSLAARRLTVLRREALSPRMLRLTLGGEELGGFVADGPADHVKLFVPDPATGELHVPRVGPQGMERPAGAPVVRDYTPRAVRPGEIDIDVVLHDHAGPVSAWAAQAAPGDAVAIAGPRASQLVPLGADHLLLGGDETALPALARWLERVPVGTPADVLVELSDRADEGYLAAAVRPEHTVHHLYRDGREPGTTTLLAEAAQELVPRDGTGYAWFAGEATSLVPLRRWLRGESSFAAGNVKVDGYWKRGVVALDHHAPIDPQDTDD
ncbi:siderophore-interacting protein [Georgenia sp. SYP-B2076]|uniref:siderophore-interacting protein n=1 Tax=Georgenia sp. SYP-B2076 TaxID=2495881 RepID=UPI000F8DD110|nr:siderophore-interacting protein [Georgenia sp. SYP-B2076]